MCCHSDRINSRRQQHQDYDRCINKMSPRIQIQRSTVSSLLNTTKETQINELQWLDKKRREKTTPPTLLFFRLDFLFNLIFSPGSTVSHHQMNAVICGQDNPIRTGFSPRNAIKSLKMDKVFKRR